MLQIEFSGRVCYRQQSLHLPEPFEFHSSIYFDLISFESSKQRVLQNLFWTKWKLEVLTCGAKCFHTSAPSGFMPGLHNGHTDFSHVNTKHSYILASRRFPYFTVSFMWVLSGQCLFYFEITFYWSALQFMSLSFLVVTFEVRLWLLLFYRVQWCETTVQSRRLENADLKL